MTEKILELTGPSGFGKTFILNAIVNDEPKLAKQTTPNFIWHYSFIDFSDTNNKNLLTDKSGSLLIKKIIEGLNCKIENENPKIDDLGECISNIVTAILSNKNYNEETIPIFLFIFDSLDVISEDVIKWIVGKEGLVSPTINGCFEIFRTKPIIKLILAARRSVIKDRNWCIEKPVKHSVSCLNINVVRNLFEQAIDRDDKLRKLRKKGEINNEIINRYSNEIFLHTNGHPRCVNRLCIRLSESIMKRPKLTKLFKENVVGVILQETLNHFHESIQYLLWTLSPFRRMNEDVLSVLAYHKFILLDGGSSLELSDQSQLIKQLLKTALFTADELKFTYKFEYAVRRILHQWMKYEAKDVTKKLNEIACIMYDERIKDFDGLGKGEEAISTISTDWRRIYVQEAVYHHILKLEFTKRKNWLKFLEEEINNYLDILYSRATKLEILGRLKELIEDNWEKDEELHEELNRVTGERNAGERLDQVMKKSINFYDDKWKKLV